MLALSLGTMVGTQHYPNSTNAPYALTTSDFLATSQSSPEDQTPFAGHIPVQYELSLKVDPWLLGASAAMLTSALILNHARNTPVIPGDPAHVWSFDRGAIGRNNATQDMLSTIILDTLIAGAPLALAATQWNGSVKSLAPAVIVAESILASAAVNQLTKSLVHRPRPYTYAQKSASGEEYRSFYSGHTTLSFAAVTSATLVLHDLHPQSSWPLWLGAVGFAGATSVGVLRVTSGKHFPSDVIVGALAGAAIGWAVPAIHKKYPGLRLSVSPTGVAISGTF